jgi:hypothetical protein
MGGVSRKREQEEQTMAIDREELKKKALEAASAEEIMEIMKAAGEEITAEAAAQLFEKAQAKKTDKELSLDELEAVAGGEDRDWLRDGCAATVEAGSDCYGTDMCGLWPVTYEHRPTRHKCSVCGGILYSNGSTGGGFFEEEVYHYKCASCGAQFKTHGGELIKYSK